MLLRPCIKALPRYAALAAIVATMLSGWGCAQNAAEPDDAALFGVSALPPAAGRAPGSSIITVELEATVTTVVDPGAILGGAVAVGDDATGLLVYDETAPDEHHKLDVGRYRFRAAPSGIDVVIADLVFSTDNVAPDMTIKLTNDKKTNGVKDSYEAKSTGNADVTPGVGVATIVLSLVDDTATALDSDDLAGQRPDGAAWNAEHTLTISGVDGWKIEAEIGRIGDRLLDPPLEAKKEFHQE